MTRGPSAYEAITDWSKEGRRRLVAERGTHLRALLDEAFTQAVDGGLSLAAFRFAGDDPVTDAVEWCIARFEVMDVDPSRLHAGSRSLRLFTEVQFWLAQREGAAGFRRATRAQADRRSAAPARCEDVVDALERQQQLDLVRKGVITLRERCCAALVGWWLEGSAELRHALFAPQDASEIWPTREAAFRSPKERSFHIADALFRYYALFAGLVSDEEEPLRHRACVLTWFHPCSDEPPYEVPRTAVRAILREMPSRQMTSLRHEGVRVLIRRCIEHADAALGRGAALDRHLACTSLRASLLHRFKVDDDDLSRRIKALARGAP